MIGPALLGLAAPATPAPCKAHVGLHRHLHRRKSKGIYRCEIDLATGKLGEPELAAEVANPSFLAVHPTGTLPLRRRRGGEFGGKKGGAVSGLRASTPRPAS